MESNFAISFVIQILGATFVWKSDGFQIIDIISGGRFEEKRRKKVVVKIQRTWCSKFRAHKSHSLTSERVNVHVLCMCKCKYQQQVHARGSILSADNAMYTEIGVTNAHTAPRLPVSYIQIKEPRCQW